MSTTPTPPKNAVRTKPSGPRTAAPANRLAGQFLECCNCVTICPCWIEEQPTEEHCTGIYVWTFDDTSALAGESLAERSVAIAAYHAKTRGTQSVIFVDERLAEPTRRALIDAFSGRTLASFEALRKLIGTVIDTRAAAITRQATDGGWSVTIAVGDSLVAKAEGRDKKVKEGRHGVDLEHSALHAEFSLEGKAQVQEVGIYEMSLVTLPVGSFVHKGRAGMAGRFAYATR